MQCNSCKKENREIATYCKWCGQLISTENSLDKIIGLKEVKQEIQSIIRIHQSLKQRATGNNSSIRININSLIIGNTGTGKTTLAQVLHHTFLAHHIISNPKLHLIDAVNYDQFLKNWDKNIREARGGILFIDNVQKLLPQGYAESINQLDRLFVEMERWNNDPIVILAGLPEGFESFLNANPAIYNRFRYLFRLPDHTHEELHAIATNELSRKFGLSLHENASARLTALFKYNVKCKDSSFGNGHLAVKVADEIFRTHSERTADASNSDYAVMPQDITRYVPENRTLEEILQDLDEFIGMNNVKEAIREIAMQVKTFQERASRGISANEKPSMHLVLTGNPGTGKTTVARKLGEIFEAIGFLENGNVIEVDRSQMVSQYIGETPKVVDELCDRATGGILFIDEAYTLAPQNASGEKDKQGTEAIEKLMKRMEDDRDKFVVIAAGYQQEMNHFLGINSGLRSRFDRIIHIDDYNADELYDIYNIQAKKKNYVIEEEAQSVLRKSISQIYMTRDRGFANGREMRKLFEETISKLSTRLNTLSNPTNEDFQTIIVADIPVQTRNEISIDDCLKELDEFVGMDNIKEEIRQLASFINIEMQRNNGRINKIPGMHFVFTGNPGTGKTTVARIFAKIFKTLGLVAKEQLTEADRSSLVAGYQGQTAIKTNQLIDHALGGVLFIDEAYNLLTDNQDSFGKEAVDTLLKRLEDDKGKFICIVAGYTKEMHGFIDSNPGLKSRFNRTIEFKDYNPKQLTEVFKRLTRKRVLRLTDEANNRLYSLFEKLYISKDKNFGNAREALQIFETALQRQGTRLSKINRTPEYDPAMLHELTWTDISGEEPKQIKSLDDIIAELDEFIGMVNVKESIKAMARQIKFNKMRTERGIGGTENMVLNLILTGNPGTGKTTIARKLGEIFKAIGILPTDKVIEADRSQIVGQYMGQTPKNMNALCDRALGGILFIDEAYTLSPTPGNGQKDTYGTEAIETLMARMENDRGKFVLILAGYPNEMKSFLRVNPGLSSRITQEIHIDDYSAEELQAIFIQMAGKNQYKLNNEAKLALLKQIQQLLNHKSKGFGNAREIRKLYDKVQLKISERVSSQTVLRDEDLTTILPEDFSI